MAFYLMIFLLIFFGCFKLWKKRDFDKFNVSVLIANFIYVLFFLNQYLIAEDVEKVKNALIFAYLIFYIFLIPFLSLAVLFVLVLFKKIKEKYFYR